MIQIDMNPTNKLGLQRFSHFNMPPNANVCMELQFSYPRVGSLIISLLLTMHPPMYRFNIGKNNVHVGRYWVSLTS